MEFGFIFGILGNVFSICMFASPVPTFAKIVKEKDTQDFSCLPYVVTLVQCLLWVFYGLPFVTRGAILVLSVNLAGVLFQLSYVTVFFVFSYTRPFSRSVMKVLALLLVGLAVLATVTLTVLPVDSRSPLVGSLSVLVTIAMYVSPLSIMRMVIRTQNVKFMPLLLSVFMFCNSVAWVGYAFLSNDIFVLIPNMIGTLSGTVQLLLYAIYRKGSNLQISDKLLPEDTSGKAASIVSIP